MKRDINYELESKGLRLVIHHINLVQNHMSNVVSRLIDRLANHDMSKYSQEEIGLVLGKPAFDKLEYMSDEERAALASVKDSVQHHYKRNQHHPEHYADGINGMSLLDLMEMACDWKAASEMSENGSYLNSIMHNTERFDMSLELRHILMNTGRQMGWIE
ncbi:MAG: hypothetical protein GY927_11770 [bacterium]|nr:hypothetical protein [bacterium]